MEEQKPRRPVYDERDREIDERSKGRAMDLVTGCAELFTILCILKGNPAWLGGLALLLMGMAAGLFYRAGQYGEKFYWYAGLVPGVLGAALLLWFAFGA